MNRLKNLFKPKYRIVYDEQYTSVPYYAEIKEWRDFERFMVSWTMTHTEEECKVRLEESKHIKPKKVIYIEK